MVIEGLLPTTMWAGWFQARPDSNDGCTPATQCIGVMKPTSDRPELDLVRDQAVRPKPYDLDAVAVAMQHLIVIDGSTTSQALGCVRWRGLLSSMRRRRVTAGHLTTHFRHMAYCASGRRPVGRLQGSGPTWHG
jgi:hypothetical protein